MSGYADLVYNRFQMPEATRDSNNEAMLASIKYRVIGSKIVAFTVEGHTVTIHTDSPSKVVLEFEDTVEFLLSTGGWKFVPGRPRKVPA